MASGISLGIDTFGDVTLDVNGQIKPHDQVLRDVVDQGILADAVGIDFIGLGEHHRADFAISSPEVVLGAIGARTTRIKLGSAVTVLSSDDPVRVFQRFSTLNAITNGRAEVVLGRGSFTESFPLFGQNLEDYDLLFEEKLDLFVQLLRNPEITWSGKTRAALMQQRVFPTLGAGGLAAWVGVGGSPESVVRAVRHDLPMMFAIIGGDPVRFKPYVDLYHRAVAQLNRPVRPIGVHSPGHIAETDVEAMEQMWPHYKVLHDKLGGERGWPPVTQDRFKAEIAQGSLYVGSPETVARKIAATVRTLGIARFDMKYSSGPMPHGAMMKSIQFYGARVMPMVLDLLADVKLVKA